jgi:hypothetical protein
MSARPANNPGLQPVHNLLAHGGDATGTARRWFILRPPRIIFSLLIAPGIVFTVLFALTARNRKW